MKIFKYIKADSFFRDYLPNIRNYKHKIRGKNGRGNPCSFSEEEKKQILEAVSKLSNQLKSK